MLELIKSSYIVDLSLEILRKDKEPRYELIFALLRGLHKYEHHKAVNASIQRINNIFKDITSKEEIMRDLEDIRDRFQRRISDGC